MPTRRMIEPAIWQSESMGRLTIRQRLMFIGMFSNADDQGRLRASAPVIRSMIFPFDDISLDDIEADILKIASEDCIMLYGSNGSRFAQVINWWIYQTPQWAYPSKIPKADGWSDRLRFRHSGQVITENWDTKRPSIDQNRIEVPKAIGKGLGKDLPSPDGEIEPDKPKRKRTERDIAIDDLESRFVDLTGLPKPERDTDKQKKSGAASWWIPLGDIWTLCGKDTDKAAYLIDKAYRKLIDDSMTVASPKSLVKTATALYAKNGHKPDIDTDRQSALAKAFR